MKMVWAWGSLIKKRGTEGEEPSLPLSHYSPGHLSSRDPPLSPETLSFAWPPAPLELGTLAQAPHLVSGSLDVCTAL